MTIGPNETGRVGPLRIRSPQRFVAGVVLLGICFLVFWAVADLSSGTVQNMGPGMFPRALAALLGISGTIQIAVSFWLEGQSLEQWSFRGPVLVTAGILLFALTVRPLGLSVAGMLALAVSGFAIQDARPRQVIVFSALVTVACVILFRYLLEMSIPVLVIPGTGIRF
jgi:putative tricarboxylic transport membrane protein